MASTVHYPYPMKTTNNKTVYYNIIRKSENGRTWYQSRNVGEITRLRAKLWRTADKDAAIMLAAELGGHVVEEV